MHEKKTNDARWCKTSLLQFVIEQQAILMPVQGKSDLSDKSSVE